MLRWLMLMLLIAVIALEVSCGPEENDDANPMPARQASQALIQAPSGVGTGVPSATSGATAPAPRHQQMEAVAQQIESLKSKNADRTTANEWSQSDRAALDALYKQYRDLAPTVQGSVAPRPSPRRPLLVAGRTPEAEALYFKAKASVDPADPGAKDYLRKLKRKLYFSTP